MRVEYWSLSNFCGSVFGREQFAETRSDLVMLIREQRIDGDDKFVVEGNGGEEGSPLAEVRR